MTKLDKTLWVDATYDQMDAAITAILTAAGFTHHHVRFCDYETTMDGVRDDLSDWMVKHPAFDSSFARGKVEFVLAEDDNGDPSLTEARTDPTWADVLVVGEKSCRARGAPELDHVFLESVEPDGPRRRGVQRYVFHWGS